MAISYTKCEVIKIYICPIVQKLALEKISDRIHEIWEKMEDAAVQSIEYNQSPDESGRGSKMMSNTGSE